VLQKLFFQVFAVLAVAVPVELSCASCSVLLFIVLFWIVFSPATDSARIPSRPLPSATFSLTRFPLAPSPKRTPLSVLLFVSL